MAQVIDKRVTAEIEGAFVVFLIGMRINKFWKAWKWLPIFFAMPRMLRELEQRPEAGFLGASGYFGSPRRPMLVQFWRSFEHLETYARSRDAAHWPAWVDLNKRVGSSGDVGIWHETYLVPAGAYECVYNNMPPTGLGTVATLVPAAGRRATAGVVQGFVKRPIRTEPPPNGSRSERTPLGMPAGGARRFDGAPVREMRTPSTGASSLPLRTAAVTVGARFPIAREPGVWPDARHALGVDEQRPCHLALTRLLLPAPTDSGGYGARASSQSAPFPCEQGSRRATGLSLSASPAATPIGAKE